MCDIKNQTFYIVYKTICNVNNKIYIGQHVQHETSAFDRYLGSGKLLNYAIEKYGKENFVREVIELCENNDDLDIKEVYWIDVLSSTSPNIGYNLISKKYSNARNEFEKSLKE